MEVKLAKRIGEAKFGPNRPKSVPKLVFFAIFSSLVHWFSFKLHRMIAWNIVLLLVEVKPAKKKNEGGVKFWPNGPKLDPKLDFLSFFQV